MAVVIEEQVDAAEAPGAVFEAAGVVRPIEPLTLRSRLRKVTHRSLGLIRDHFA